MLTEKDYCDYKLVLELKELGYDYIRREGLIHLYEAQRFLREEKGIGIFVSGFKNGYTFWVNDLLSGDTLYQGFFDNQTNEKYKFYEEALSEGIKEAVKILKEK